jgi:MFS family permease
MKATDGGQRPHRLVAGALMLDAAATLPAALTGAVAVAVREDLGITDQHLGFALSACFLGGAVVAMLVQRVLDPLGWRRAALLGAGMATLALAGIPLATGGAMLTLAMLAGGASLAITMPASNLLLITVDGSERLATLLAVKQASVPIALLGAGLAVPPVTAIAGWRALFVLGLLVAPVGLALVWRLMPRERGNRPLGSERHSRARATKVVSPQHHSRTVDPGAGMPPVRLAGAALGVAFGSCLPGALTAYLVISLTSAGLTPASAALLYGGANAAGIVARLAGGSYARRTASDGFGPVAVMMILGGAGALLLGTTALPLLVLGSAMAFGLGWGWPGLLFYAVMRARPDAPAAASAVVQSGGLSGAAVGPIVAGAVAGAAGWTASWWVIGGLAILGGTFMLNVRRSVRGS